MQLPITLIINSEIGFEQRLEVASKHFCNGICFKPATAIFDYLARIEGIIADRVGKDVCNAIAIYFSNIFDELPFRDRKQLIFDNSKSFLFVTLKGDIRVSL